MQLKPLLLLAAAGLMTPTPSAAQADGFADLGRAAPGFAEITPGKTLVFPRDFGAHSEFRTEWWYLTANLRDASGAAYGVQWTLFRQSVDPGPERSGWANQNLWMGHAAATSATDHVFAETLARGGVGQAGVVAAPFRAWIDDWSLAAPQGGAGLTRLQVSASGANFRYLLDLSSEKPLVLNGENGFSRKSERGQASYYFSEPFYSVRGLLDIGGKEIQVFGEAWMDREWSSQPLGAGQTGWDWFSLHLTTGEKVMLFRLRNPTGRDFLAGTWVFANGKAQPLRGDDIALTPQTETTLDQHRLPTGWKAQVKSHAFEVETRPLNAKSWMATRFSYWEGPIAVSGSHAGEGYLEMTGYCPRRKGRRLSPR